MTLFLGFLAGTTAWAQEPEAQTETLPKWHYNLHGTTSGRITTGTFRQLVLANQAEIEFSSRRWHFSNLATYRLNKTNGFSIENDWYELATTSCYVKGEKLFPTGFYSFDNNLVFRVDSRHLGGLGLSTQKKWAHGFSRLDLGAGYESTLFNGTEFENSDLIGSKREKTLVMMRILHRHQLLKGKIIFSNMIFYRHSLKEKQDFFLRIAPSLSLKITKGLSVSANYIFRFENVHLSALSDTNSLLAFGFAYQFQTL